MLRQWRINLKRKKQKKAKNITKYPKFTSFIYSTIAIIYSPFGYIFARYNEQAKQEKPNIYKQLEDINLELDKIIVDENQKSKLKKINQKIELIKKDIKQPMTDNTKIYFNNKIKELETKVNFIKNPNTISSKEVTIIRDSVKNNFKNKKINVPQNINKKLISKLSLMPLIIKKENFDKQEKILKDKKSGDVEYIKKTTKEIKIIEDNIIDIEQKISIVKEYNHYYDLENNLKYLRAQITKLTNKYDELKINFNINLNIDFDKYKLVKSKEKLENMLEKIDNDLFLIECKKKEMITKKIKKEEKEEIKKQEKQKQTTKKIKEVDEFIQAKEHVLNNIINQNKYLNSYLKQLAKSTNKKKTLFSSLTNFSKTVLNFTISLLPISIFKNKLLGTLVSAIMINNSIKTMRKMVNPKLQINYETFLESYTNNKNIISNTYYFCNNSLYELSLLKDELLLLGANKDAKELLTQITTIENNIFKQMEELKLKDSTLDKIYVKIKK